MSPKLVKDGSPCLVLAPMEGVTDAPVRELLTSFQPWDFCVSEFIRIAHRVPPDHIFLEYVPELSHGSRTKSGTTVIPQLLGGDPTLMAEAAKRLAALGAVGVDINFGCPAKTVNRHDGGATLLKYPERIKDIVSAVRAALPDTVSLSAKLRLGWDDPGAIDLNAEMAAAGGADWITIHGRTKVNGYTPPAYWKPIARVRNNLSIPVIANGEIWSREDLARCRNESECEHIMIGRGALANPTMLQVNTTGNLPWSQLMRALIVVLTDFKMNDRHVLARAKQWLNMAAKQETIDFFDKVKRVDSATELLRIITECELPPQTSEEKLLEAGG